MKILWIATKEPWPPADGGRLVLLETLKSMAAFHHSIALVAPSALPESERAEIARQLAPWCRATLVASSPRAAWRDAAAALPGGEAWTVRRHRRREVGAAVLELTRRETFDAVVAEQLQALSQAPRGGAAPVVLRAQNVESDLWRGAAALGGWRAPALRREAERLERAEAAAVRGVACTVALTGPDADRLRELGGEDARVETIAAPFPPALDAGPRLSGDPALVLFGSAGWAPNRDQARWFVRSIWPAARAALPAARLHVFGGEPEEAAGVEWHRAPEDSRTAFAEGAIFVVPLRIGSGVRMKILEAWARGIPVISTPEGAAGLPARAGEDLIVADAAMLAGEIVRLAGDSALRARLVVSARESLRREHAPAVVGQAWQTLLAGLAAR